jgi:hypothetical protein
MDNFDRYYFAKIDGNLQQLPFIEFPENPEDKYIKFIEGNTKTRFDILAQKYYSNPTLGYLILMANPEYVSEHDIPDGTIIRIPFPKDRVLTLYNEKIRNILNI